MKLGKVNFSSFISACYCRYTLLLVIAGETEKNTCSDTCKPYEKSIFSSIGFHLSSCCNFNTWGVFRRLYWVYFSYYRLTPLSSDQSNSGIMLCPLIYPAVIADDIIFEIIWSPKHFSLSYKWWFDLGNRRIGIKGINSRNNCCKRWMNAST